MFIINIIKGIKYKFKSINWSLEIRQNLSPIVILINRLIIITASQLILKFIKLEQTKQHVIIIKVTAIGYQSNEHE